MHARPSFWRLGNVFCVVEEGLAAEVVGEVVDVAAITSPVGIAGLDARRPLDGGWALNGLG